MVLLWVVETAQQLAEVQLSGVARSVDWAPRTDPMQQRCFVACSSSFKDRPAAVVFYEAGLSCQPLCLLKIEEPILPSAATQVALVSPTGHQICSVHVSGEIIFWHAATGAMLERLAAHEGPVSQVAFSGDRNLMASCGRLAMEVKIWDVSSGRATLLKSYICDRPLNAVALRPTLEQHEFTPCEDASCRPLCVDCVVGGGQDARDVALIGAGSDDQFEPFPLRFDEAGTLVRHVMPGSEDARGRGGHFGPINALTLSADGAICVSGSEDGNVRLRELFGPSQARHKQFDGQLDLSSCAQNFGQAGLPAKGMFEMQHSRENRREMGEMAPHSTPWLEKQLSGGDTDSWQQDPQNFGRHKKQSIMQHIGESPLQLERQRSRPVQTPSQKASPIGSGDQSRALFASLGPYVSQHRGIAICDFDPSTMDWPPGSSQRALPLQKGQEIVLLHDMGSGWSWGCPVGYPKLTGFIPTNFVAPLPVHNYQGMLPSAQPCAGEATSIQLHQEITKEGKEEEGDCSQS